MLFAGLLILVKGADVLVDSAAGIAKILKVPEFIVGLFIVAMGTSAPEAAIGIFSGIKGTNVITLGDVVGSNIVNIALIIGITASIFSLESESLVPKLEIFISIFTQVCLVVMIYTSYTLSRWEAALLLLGMLLFFGYVVFKTRSVSEDEEPETAIEEEVFDYIESEEVLAEEIEGAIDEGLKLPSMERGEDEKSESLQKLILLFLIGLAALVLGANLAVNSAVDIAYELGLSKEFVGLTLVAFGTSLPELVTCLVAAFRKEADLAIGNIVGSNIFNVLFILGVSGMIHPISVRPDVFFDLFFMIFISVLLFAVTLILGRITKKAGFVFVMVYFLYIAIKLGTVG